MYKSGEEFLNKLYKELYKSDEVMHTASSNLSKEENIKKYMDRLDKVHNLANKKETKNLLYKMYYDKYIIKQDAMPRYLSYNEKETIIKAQKDSLGKWLDYLTGDNAVYPMWAKFWVFNGMLKIGTYDEQNDTYMKRNNKTTVPFIEANPEVIAKCVELVSNLINENEMNDDKLNQLMESGNLKKMYTLFLSKQKKEIYRESGIEGIWKKYDYNSKENAIELSRLFHWMVYCW